VYAGYRQNRRDITLRRAVKSKSKHLVRDPELCRTKVLERRDFTSSGEKCLSGFA
jgi:hypothetical protein